VIVEIAQSPGETADIRPTIAGSFLIAPMHVFVSSR
jgi:hypothetical protein